MVEYKDFCREIETAFGKEELEKNPLVVSKQHDAQIPSEANVLSADEQDKANDGLRKIGERVKILFNKNIKRNKNNFS